MKKKKKRKRKTKNETNQKQLLADFVIVQGVSLSYFPHGSVEIEVRICLCTQQREARNGVHG